MRALFRPGTRRIAPYAHVVHLPEAEFLARLVGGGFAVRKPVPAGPSHLTVAERKVPWLSATRQCQLVLARTCRTALRHPLKGAAPWPCPDAARAPGRSAASNASEANERDTTIAQGAQTELLRATARGSGSRRGARAEDGAIGGWRRACPTCRAGPAPPDGLPPGLAHPHAEVVARG
eukprot:CAMPEP_0202101042 /NCGR_PEP_ID=MMETSP0965-20130614/3490_1 /ASSEMBLY_ACC=CAM_ASM_000507 /TAXON_ID=4773 /ORGANISM="Schizochytrium aggregatum, Strain ATCC28209" /LENGTH=177 /DNA_ID=CAMNT_0048669725 /DNA_START=461 /DNA_END=992 /DNA_ORIENTATION=+